MLAPSTTSLKCGAGRTHSGGRDRGDLGIRNYLSKTLQTLVKGACSARCAAPWRILPPRAGQITL
jgi:hypothetical protein